MQEQTAGPASATLDAGLKRGAHEGRGGNSSSLHCSCGRRSTKWRQAAAATCGTRRPCPCGSVTSEEHGHSLRSASPGRIYRSRTGQNKSRRIPPAGARQRALKQ